MQFCFYSLTLLSSFGLSIILRNVFLNNVVFLISDWETKFYAPEGTCYSVLVYFKFTIQRQRSAQLCGAESFWRSWYLLSWLEDDLVSFCGCSLTIILREMLKIWWNGRNFVNFKVTGYISRLSQHFSRYFVDLCVEVLKRTKNILCECSWITQKRIEFWSYQNVFCPV